MLENFVETKCPYFGEYVKLKNIHSFSYSLIWFERTTMSWRGYIHVNKLTLVVVIVIVFDRWLHRGLWVSFFVGVKHLLNFWTGLLFSLTDWKISLFQFCVITRPNWTMWKKTKNRGPMSMLCWLLGCWDIGKASLWHFSLLPLD